MQHIIWINEALHLLTGSELQKGGCGGWRAYRSKTDKPQTQVWVLSSWLE